MPFLYPLRIDQFIKRLCCCTYLCSPLVCPYGHQKCRGLYKHLTSGSELSPKVEKTWEWSLYCICFDPSFISQFLYTRVFSETLPEVWSLHTGCSPLIQLLVLSLLKLLTVRPADFCIAWKSSARTEDFQEGLFMPPTTFFLAPTSEFNAAHHSHMER